MSISSRALVATLTVLATMVPLKWSQAQQQGTSGADPIRDVLLESKLSLDVRARYEFADQTHRDESNATTLRVRLGAATPELRGFQFFLEFEHNEALDRDSYQAARARTT